MPLTGWQNQVMETGTESCAFTKPVEHVGDRWRLPIVGELALFGARDG